MKSKNGKYTELFGEWLTESLGNSRYTVYYDQGDKQREPMVAAIKGFLGKKVTNVNRLADNDVMVVNDNNEIILLLEIEEVKMSPKKLLGDIFTIEMCNRFAVRINKENKYFDVSPKTRLIVAGVVPNTGSGQKKIRDIILQQNTALKGTIIIKSSQQTQFFNKPLGIRFQFAEINAAAHRVTVHFGTIPGYVMMTRCFIAVEKDLNTPTQNI